MLLRPDQTRMVPLEEFTSTSGLWKSILACRYEAALNGNTCYYCVIFHAGTNKIKKIVRFSIGDEALAYQKWFDWQEIFGGKPDTEYEEDMPTGLSELRYSPPFKIPEDDAVLKMKPCGARLFVRDITPIDEVTARAEKVGLAVVVAEENKPKPTMGIVLKVGEDPLAQELYEEGQLVMFSRYAGNTFMEAGEQYRSLELHEIIGVRDPADGIEDLTPPAKDSAAHLGAVGSE